jgi:tetratricopeptide (TPR) repeat protein
MSLSTNKDNPARLKIPLRQKIILVIFGLFLTFALLEIGLRLGGFAILSLREYRNRVSVSKKGSYRIMCLGESTTQSQYPSFLEEILNRRNIGVRFSVIDKGLRGTNTFRILEELESDLDEYHPNMVVIMMGINDGKPHSFYEVVPNPTSICFFKSFRTYKLVRLLWLHILSKFGLNKAFAEEADNVTKSNHGDDNIAYLELGWSYRRQGKFVQAEEAFKRAIEINPKNDQAYIELGWCYHNEGKLPQAEEALKRAIELNPKSDQAYFELGRSYHNQGKFPQAKEAFKRAIEINPKNDQAYLELGRSYHNQGKFPQAKEAFKRAIELNPKNDQAYFELGWSYHNQGKFPQAEEALKRAIELNPKSDQAYIELGWSYRNQGKFPQAEEAFKRAIELNPKSDQAYFELGWYYHNEGKLPQAEEALKRAIEINPKNDQAYFELGWSYHRQGKFVQVEEAFRKVIELKDPRNDNDWGKLSVSYQVLGNLELARECAKKAEALRLNYCNSGTVYNYHKLKAILDKRGIRLVCVQYPMRSIEPLRRIFQGEEDGVIFVDNENTFKEALQKTSYREYFKDIFGGDFGHCTVKGNRLLAENIANAILKKVFKR